MGDLRTADTYGGGVGNLRIGRHELAVRARNFKRGEFRVGVTVAVEGVKHRKTEPLTPAEIEASINGPITRVFTYARIASTTPQDYIAVGGDPAMLDKDGKPTKAWPLAIRKEFQAAWGNDRNLLIVAWVKANAGK